MDKRPLNFIKKRRFVTTIITALLCLCSAVISMPNSVYAAGNVIETTYDVNKTFTGLSHTHIWSFYYDDDYHWQQCDICGQINNKHTHVLTENGGSKEYCMDNGDKAFRWVCTCGYSTKPLQVIHGRYYNYKDENSYSRPSNVYLKNVLQITKADFNKWYGGKTHDGFEYTWYDYDGDGYGHVFCGGPIINRTKTKKGEYDSWGQQGTIAYIVGAEGDCAKNNPTDEYLALSMYLYYECNNNIDNCTRSGFVQYLKNKIYNKDGNPTAHALYGYDTKYANRVTDAQFKEILKEFKGTIPHPQGWGWQWSGLRCCRDNWKLHNDIGGGRTLCENETNYDNSVTNGDINNGHWTDMWDGVSVEADVSGAKYRGNEQYTDVNWPHINTASTAGTILGTSSRSEYYGKSISQLSSGTTTEWLYFADRLGKNKKILAKYYYQYKRVGHHYYVRYRAICENGGYVYRVTSRHITSNPGDSVSWTGYVDENKKGTDVTTEWLEIPTTNANRQAAWADTAYMYIRDTIDGPYIPERQTSNPEGYLDNYSQLRYYYPLIDDTAPKSYNTSTWKIKYGDNGAWENISTKERSTAATMATLKVQFSDLMQFDENLVYVHVYDNDKTTIMKQFVVGQEWVPCERITTFNGGDTDFDSQVWQATLQIQTEVVGKHQIYIQAKDSRGNLSDLIPVTVSNIDSKGPSVSVTNLNNINTWSKTKSYNVTAKDATKKFSIGLGKEDMKDCTESTTRKYTFTGDVNLTATGKGKSFAIWGQDTAGNVSYETLDLLGKQVRYLDNTAPTLTTALTIKSNVFDVKVTANDYCATIKAQGSGKTADGAGKYGFYYGYSTTNNVGTAKWTSLQTAATYTYSSLPIGTYYFWVKDYVGNVSSVKSTLAYPYEIHYYFQNINGKGYMEDTNLIATIKSTFFLDYQVTVPLPTVAGYKYSSMTIASGGKLSNGKIVITNESPANVAKKNVVSVYYNWDDGSGNTAKNLALVTFDSNKMKWYIEPGSNISASWNWTPTSTTNSSADGFDSPENVQGYFVQRLYASEGSNITTGYGAFISRGQSEVKLSTIIDKYKGNGGGNNKNWGGDFPTVTATGCTFLGWNSKADGSGTWYSAYGSGNKSGSDKSNTAVLVLDSTNKKYGLTTTLYAIWTDNAQVKASITYNQGVVNTATGIAGTASNLSPVFKQKSSTTVSTDGSIVTIPWSKDVQINITGQDKATGNYLFYSKLIGADNSHKNQDAGTTAIYAAGLGEDSGTVNTLSNSTKRDSSANKAKTTSGAYTQNAGTYHLDYNIQGTYAVSVRNESRQYEEAIKNGVIQGDPAYKHLNNIFKIKIDNTAPVITSWRVMQDRLENYRSEDIEDAIAAGLYTTFKISFSDAHNSAKGAFLNQKDTSGIQGIYIRVWDKNDTSNVKVYSVPLENVSNKVLTDNEDEELFSGTVTYPINLYAEFPSASSVIYEAYVVDNAGNVTEKIGSVIIDSNKPLPDPDDGPEEPDDPNDPTPSPSPDYPSGTLANFSIKTVIYNDMDEIFNIEDYVTYEAVSGDVGAFFQTGDVGHIDVWTIGYVTSVSPDFGAGAGDTIAEEAIKEIASGRLPSKYNMGLDSIGDYKRVWNYSQAEVLFPKYISYYDEDLHDMVTVYRSAGIKKNYSTKAYSAKEQQIYNSLVIHDGVPYAAHYTTKEDVISDDTRGWQSSGTKVRIPPYYKMKYPYSKSEKTNADGTTAYKTETHTYKATAYKNGDTDAASWIYMIYDTGSNDLHYRVIHENGVSSGSGIVEYYEELR